jgi:glycerol-3-phosphate acyltransferase PlsY
MGRALKGVDVREHGSGNLGASNAFRVLGPLPAAIILLLDLVKGLIAVLLLTRIFWGPVSAIPVEVVRVIAGAAVICGHDWSLFLGFRGGKGVATTMGVFLGLTPLVAGIAFLIWIVVVGISRYVSLGAVVAGVSLPLLMLGLRQPREFLIFSLFAGSLIVLRHTSNIKRLLNRSERKLGRMG